MQDKWGLEPGTPESQPYLQQLSSAVERSAVVRMDDMVLATDPPCQIGLWWPGLDCFAGWIQPIGHRSPRAPWP